MRAVALLALLAVATPVTAGPPWIAVELPANRIDPETRGAYLTVRTYHHETPAQLVMRGTAEGLVAGVRRSVPLRFRATRLAGVHAVDRTWDSSGVWILDIRAYDGRAEISAVVGVGPDGEAAFVRVPLHRTGAPRTISTREAAQLLESLAGGRTPPRLAAAGFGEVAPRVYGSAAALVLAGLLAVSLLRRLGRRLSRWYREPAEGV